MVSDVDTVDARAKARNVTVEEPLSNMSGFSLRTVWLNDPDGVTNYFAQVGGGRGGDGGPRRIHSRGVPQITGRARVARPCDR